MDDSFSVLKILPTLSPSKFLPATMSVQRCALSVTTSPQNLFKFAANTSIATLSACPYKFRSFNSGSRLQLSSKRKLQTATAYRPHSLEPTSPPPRNAGILESSIASAVPEVNDTRAPQLTGKDIFPSISYQDGRQSTTISEAEAQKSRPIAELNLPPKQKQPKLRPRKAAISLTPSAAVQLRSLLALPEPKMIRVGVKNRGCSGLAYHLEYVEKAGNFDEAVEQDGVKVLIDSKALFSIIGSEMDWVEDKLSQRFVFRNPNISLSSHFFASSSYELTR